MLLKPASAAPGALLSINNFHYRRAGSDAAFLDHDQLFKERGWETAVFSMAHAENLPSPWSRFFVREIELKRRYSLREKAAIAGKVLYSREARANLGRLLQAFRPDVVHLHSVYHHISPSILPILHELGVPVVMTAHDYKLACPAYKMFDGHRTCEDCKSGSLLPLLRRRCIHGSLALSSLVAVEAVIHRRLGSYDRHVDRVVCPSRFMLDKLIEWGWPRERLVYIPNFFTASMWRPRFQPGDYLLYFGRLAPEKGLPTLVAAAARARRPLRIVGWGPERQRLEALARDAGVDITFIDRLDAGRLGEVIRHARCIVLPSEYYENASLAVLEAFACGKPVIASRIGGNPELVHEQENGWLFEPGNVAQLAECLDRACRTPDSEIEALGRAAHAFVHAGFSSEAYYESTCALYRSLGAERIGPSTVDA